jgi:CPA1 family monovalent cation:H+ antiporter
MELIPLLSAILVTTAVFAWINHRLLHLPTTIGVMVVALLMSLGLFALSALGFDVQGTAREVERALPFTETLMEGMLSFLLFAGALHVDLRLLWGQRRAIALLATVGVLVTTALVGGAAWLAFGALGLEVGLGPCLLFGALISPTDPIAVLAILKTMTVPRELETKIAGESLLNDGVAVVVFLGLLGAAGLSGSHAQEGSMAGHLLQLFAIETLGGLVFGAAIGLIAYAGFRSIDSSDVELLISLALVAGGYALAQALHVSGPIAMVTAGLLIGDAAGLEVSRVSGAE